MHEVTLFCGPREVYRERNEKEVAEAYTKMAADQFDRLVVFKPEYAAAFRDSPDYEEEVNRKEGKHVNLTIFYRQPIVTIGGDNVSLVSSSNLFNPECSLKNDDDKPLYLPDIEVIQIAGSMRDVEKMVSGVRELYEAQNGWAVYVHDGATRTKRVNGNPKRFSEPIEILDPQTLLLIAAEKVRYDPNRLCFSV